MFDPLPADATNKKSIVADSQMSASGDKADGNNQSSVQHQTARESDRQLSFAGDVQQNIGMTTQRTDEKNSTDFNRSQAAVSFAQQHD